MECMYCRIPVISTKISGIPELIESDGLLVEPNNAKKIAEKIKVLMKDKTLRTNMGLNGRKKIEKEFNIHKEVRKLTDLWNSIK
ncbi:glycosyltransferase [archaeon]|nr:glycosyltransferase [Nanoarchaeota archaeon]MCG2723881.1 glycosyltransferase [archaeon]